jgi:hypothetical protein
MAGCEIHNLENPGSTAGPATSADVAKLADAPGLGPGGAIRGSSNPPGSTFEAFNAEVQHFGTWKEDLRTAQMTFTQMTLPDLD